MPIEQRTHPVTRIRSSDPPLLDVCRELAGSTELLSVLVRRQIAIRYAQTVMGAFWVLLQPLMTAALYTLVFGMFVRVNTGNVPYPLFSYSGMVLWMVFAQGLERGGISLIQDERLISKIYFPRLWLPWSAVLSVLVDFAISSAILIPVAWIWGLAPSPIRLLWIPVSIAPALLAAAGAGTLLSSLNIRWRDLRQVAPFLVQIMVWVTPVAYSFDMVPKPWDELLLLNPVSAPVQLFRHATLGTPMPPLWALGLSFLTSSLLFVVGTLVFRRVERTFADYI